MSDFVYVISYWYDCAGEWLMRDYQTVVIGDEHAEEKIRKLITTTGRVRSDYSGIFTGEVDEAWITEWEHIKKCDLF